MTLLSIKEKCEKYNYICVCVRIEVVNDEYITISVCVCVSV